MRSEPDDIVGVDPALSAVVTGPHIRAAVNVGGGNKVCAVIDCTQLIVVIVAGVAAECQITGLNIAAYRFPVCVAAAVAAGMHGS